jgi:hypothetical protein
VSVSVSVSVCLCACVCVCLCVCRLVVVQVGLLKFSLTSAIYPLRPMNVAPPYANKKCWQREVEHAQKLHKDKLATIRPTSQTNSRTLLDFERPKTMDMTHVKNKSKKLLVRAAAPRVRP